MTTEPSAAIAASPAIPIRGDTGYDGLAPLEARAPKLALLTALVFCAWLGVLLLSRHEGAAHVYLSPAMRTRYLNAHVIGFCLGLGTVFAVDVAALLTLFGAVSVNTAARFSLRVDWLIWIGFALVCVSGAYLQPDFGNGWVVANFFVVLALGLNAVHARAVLDHVRASPRGSGISTLPRSVLARAVGGAVLSQALWWTSMAVGYATRTR
jgi:hypothetical protein